MNFMHLFLMINTTQRCIVATEVKPNHFTPQIWMEVTGLFLHEGRPQYHSTGDQVSPEPLDVVEKKNVSALAGNWTIANQVSDWASALTWAKNTKKCGHHITVQFYTSFSSVEFELLIPHSLKEGQHIPPRYLWIYTRLCRITSHKFSCPLQSFWI